MVAPVGFGRTIPLMAPADLPAAGTPTGAGPKADPKKGGAAALAKAEDGKALAAAGKAADPKAGAKKSASKSAKSGAAKKKTKIVPVDVNALKKDVDDLKSRTFKATVEGTNTSGSSKQLQFLKAEAELESVKLFGADTTYVSLSGKLTANTGDEEAAGLTPGISNFGTLRQATSDSKWFGSATLRLNHNSSEGNGYKTSTGLGFTDNQWSWDAKATTSSFIDVDSLVIYLNGALATPTLQDAKWSQSGKIGLKYTQADKTKKPDQSALKNAEISFDVLNKADTVSSKMVIKGGLQFGVGQTLDAEYLRVVVGNTKQSFKLTYGIPLADVVSLELEGRYDNNEKTVQYGNASGGISLEGTPLPQPSGLESQDALNGLAKFIFSTPLSGFNPFLGVGISKTTSAVEDLKDDATRFYAIAGFELNKAK
jgi:hypothetical protein